MWNSVELEYNNIASFAVESDSVQPEIPPWSLEMKSVLLDLLGTVPQSTSLIGSRI